MTWNLQYLRTPAAIHRQSCSSFSYQRQTSSLMILLTTLLLALCCWNLPPTAFAYNLDTINYNNYNGSAGSMFGFSMTLYKDREGSWVIVGAPKADEYNPYVHEEGVVYVCRADVNAQCRPLGFDQIQNKRDESGLNIETKDHQWFGATVSSAGEFGGPILACAPRYVFHTTHPSKVARIEPVGTCHMATNTRTNFTEFSPCRTVYVGHHRQGSCQAGFSAAVTKDGERLFIGAPGAYYWQGQIHGVDLLNRNKNGYSTAEGSAADDDSYLGYSAVTGDFKGDGQQGVAAGMPRGGKLQGKVIIYNWDLSNYKNITGEQIGGYFGYAMCVVDVDGDGKDDLIVGAPMFTTEAASKEGKYDVGRIYIFQNDDKYSSTSTRDGVNSRGRFGLALASLGDVNLDGYGDFAVGAPYDGKFDRGAVYIFHGSKDGVLEKPSQIITAEEIMQNYNFIDLKTFGFALAGGQDIDGNAYNDLAIGAYDSNTVFLLKARPVVVLQATTRFAAANKLISLDDKKNCFLKKTGQQVVCTTLESCFAYNNQNAPDSIDLQVNWQLDAKKPKSPRLFFKDFEGTNIYNASSLRLYRGQKAACQSFEVYLIDPIVDKLTPLEVEMNYEIKRRTLVRNTRSILDPIIDQNRPTFQKDAINIQKNCGPDNECIPDIQLRATSVERYLHGSKDPLMITIYIANKGEDAFEANFYMNIPKGLHYNRIENPDQTAISCKLFEKKDLLLCNLGNPMPADSVIKFAVALTQSDYTNLSYAYSFTMNVNSTNPERPGGDSDNQVKREIGIWFETDLTIEGGAYPTDSTIYYNTSQYTEMDLAKSEHDVGPQVVSWYNLRNKGPSTIEELEVFILWPYMTEANETLVYLLKNPETSGPIRCEQSPLANDRYLELDQILNAKSYLQLIASVEKSSQLNADKQELIGIAGIGGNVISGGQGTKLTAEEKQRIEAENNREAEGDDSDNTIDRAKNATVSDTSTSTEKRVIFVDGKTHILDDTQYRHWSNLTAAGDGGSGHFRWKQLVVRSGVDGNQYFYGQGGKIYRVGEKDQPGKTYHWSRIWRDVYDDDGRKYIVGNDGRLKAADNSIGALDLVWNQGTDFLTDAVGRKYNVNREGHLVVVSQIPQPITPSPANVIYDENGRKYVMGSDERFVPMDGSAGGRVLYWNLNSNRVTDNFGRHYTIGDDRRLVVVSDVQRPAVQPATTRSPPAPPTVSSVPRIYWASQTRYIYDSEGREYYADNDGTLKVVSGGSSPEEHFWDIATQAITDAQGRKYTIRSVGGKFVFAPVVTSSISGTGSISEDRGTISTSHWTAISRYVLDGEGRRFFAENDGRLRLVEGRGTQDSYVWDPNSQIITDSRGRLFTVDKDRKLVQLSGVNGSGSGGGGGDRNGSNTVTLQYVYDVDGKKYFFGDDGRLHLTEGQGGGGRILYWDRVTNIVTDTNGKRYNFGTDGRLRPEIENSNLHWTTISRYVNDVDGRPYYANDDGKLDVADGRGGGRVLFWDKSNGFISDTFNRRYTVVDGKLQFHSISRSGGGSSAAFWNKTTSFKTGPDGKPYDVESSTQFYHSDANIGGGLKENVVSSAVAHSAGRIGGGSSYNDLRKFENIPIEAEVSQDLSLSQTRSATESASSNGGGRRRMYSEQDGEFPKPKISSGGPSYDTSRQGSHGFHVATVELNNNHNAGNAGQSSTQFSQGSYSSGTGSSPAEYQYTHRQHRTTFDEDIKKIENNNNDDYYYDEDPDLVDEIPHQELPSPRDASKPAYSSSHLHRSKRQNGETSDSDAEFRQALDCKAFSCGAVRCVAGPLRTNEEAWLAIRTRVAAKTLEKLAKKEAIDMSTMAVARITKLPSIGSPKDKKIRNHEVKFKVAPEQDLTKPEVVPLWIIVLSACAGTALLLLLILLMYKLGFFRRNRPSHSSERQPLNRNGNYHGDEHL